MKLEVGKHYFILIVNNIGGESFSIGRYRLMQMDDKYQKFWDEERPTNLILNHDLDVFQFYNEGKKTDYYTPTDWHIGRRGTFSDYIIAGNKSILEKLLVKNYINKQLKSLNVEVENKRKEFMVALKNYESRNKLAIKLKKKYKLE